MIASHRDSEILWVKVIKVSVVKQDVEAGYIQFLPNRLKLTIPEEATINLRSVDSTEAITAIDPTA